MSNKNLFSFKVFHYYISNTFYFSPMNAKDILKITGIPVLLASMCCLSPVIFFLLGIVSLSAATEMTDIFYGTYKWVFRGVWFVAFIGALWWYFRSKWICTLDQAKRQKNKIINTVLLTFSFWVLAYFFFLYVVVHYLGKWLDVWK